MATAFFGSLPLTGCMTPQALSAGLATSLHKRPNALKFTAVPHYTGNEMVVADGYQARAFLHLGEPLVDGLDAFRDDRMHAGESFAYRMGDNHDGMWFFGMTGGAYDPNQSERALLALNHEYTNDNLHPKGFLAQENPSASPIFKKLRLASDIRRDANAHGVAVVELKRNKDNTYELVKNSRFNKRYTSNTLARLSGAGAGSVLMQTKFDPKGLTTRGINNQCGAGLSPWGTF